MLCSLIVKSLPAGGILYDMFHKFLTESLLWDIIILTIYLHGTMIKYKIKAAWEV